MIILEKELSEETGKIYEEITESLHYPIIFTKLDVSNIDDVTKPTLFDPNKGSYEIKLDNELEDKLFENALIRNMIYCQQMDEGAPMLTPVKDDYQITTTIAMINSVIMDIDLENRMKKYGMYIEDISTMRMSDLFNFLHSDTVLTMKELYNTLASLQVTLLHFTCENKENVAQIRETFKLTDADVIAYMDKEIEIIEKYGCDTVRGQMRCMRKIGLALGLKDKAKLHYEGKVSVL